MNDQTDLMRRHFWLPALLFLVLCVVACGPTETSPTPDAGDASSAPDTTATDAGPDAAADAATQGQFQMGTNPVGQATPDAFEPISEGTAVPFTWGVQGSWMVVLAFRSQDLVEGLFDIRASITFEGEEAGNIWWEAQETFPGGDGWDYFYSLFLAIDGDPPAEGTPVQIRMTVEDEEGNSVEREMDVVAGPTVGGPG